MNNHSVNFERREIGLVITLATIVLFGAYGDPLVSLGGFIGCIEIR